MTDAAFGLPYSPYGSVSLEGVATLPPRSSAIIQPCILPRTTTAPKILLSLDSWTNSGASEARSEPGAAQEQARSDPRAVKEQARSGLGAVGSG